MSDLDLDAFRITPLKRQPYDYVVVPGFVKPQAFSEIVAAYPAIDKPGSLPPSTLDCSTRFQRFLAELEAEPFRRAVEEKFKLDLTGRPTMITVRARTRARDGTIHTDTESKIITVLIYFNQSWDADGGRLRILRRPDRLDDYAEEISPYGGTLLAFRRSKNSWHGHEPFEGPRRAIQLNWVIDQATVDRELTRHRVSAFFKKLNPFAA
ncbi:MAG: 2OG-Fe(II) oxygenase [Alphaproteobacteria bacterium]|nr:2OG-Fe(II) oxygenase [Alphaproteobacteria bacterium]